MKIKGKSKEVKGENQKGSKKEKKFRKKKNVSIPKNLSIVCIVNLYIISKTRLNQIKTNSKCCFSSFENGIKGKGRKNKDSHLKFPH
jgi:hypothetical protein